MTKKVFGLTKEAFMGSVIDAALEKTLSTSYLSEWEKYFDDYKPTEVTESPQGTTKAATAAEPPLPLYTVARCGCGLSDCARYYVLYNPVGAPTVVRGDAESLGDAQGFADAENERVNNASST